MEIEDARRILHRNQTRTQKNEDNIKLLVQSIGEAGSFAFMVILSIEILERTILLTEL